MSTTGSWRTDSQSNSEAEYPRGCEGRHPGIYECHAYPTDKGICIYMLNITDRKRAERALQEREEFFRTVVAAVPDFIFVTDSQGRAIYLNERWQQYTGVTLEGHNSLGWEYFDHPDELPMLKAKWTDAAAK